MQNNCILLEGKSNTVDQLLSNKQVEYALSICSCSTPPCLMTTSFIRRPVAVFPIPRDTSYLITCMCRSLPTNGSHFKINKTKLPKIFLTVAAAKSLDRGANDRVCNSCYKYTYRASRNHKYLLFGQLKKKTQPSTVVVVWCRYHRKNLHLTGSVFLAWSFTPGLSHRSATTTTTTTFI